MNAFLPKKTVSIGVALALVGLVAGCGGDDKKKSDNPRFDAAGLFSDAASTNEVDDVTGTLDGIGQGAEEALREVSEAIGDFLGLDFVGVLVNPSKNSDEVQSLRIKAQSMEGPSIRPCFDKLGTVQITEDFAGDETDDSFTESFSIALEFTNCAVPLTPTMPASNETEVKRMLEQPDLLFLNGTAGLSEEWSVTKTETSYRDVESGQFRVALRGLFEERENAFVLDGRASFDYREDCTFSDNGEQCSGTENIRIPRLEAVWEREEGDPRYFGRVDIRLADSFEYEWSDTGWTEDIRTTLSGRVASTAMGGSIRLSTPKEIRTIDEQTWGGFKPWDFENGFPRECPRSGILRVSDAQILFGEDTNTGDVVRIVGGSGASQGFQDCEFIFEWIEPLLGVIDVELER